MLVLTVPLLFLSVLHLQYKPKKEYYGEEKHEESYSAPKKEYYKEEKHEEYEVRLFKVQQALLGAASLACDALSSCSCLRLSKHVGEPR